MGTTIEEKFKIKILFTLFIGILIGIFLARIFWVTQFNAYMEAKHNYNYCPYCGEFIEKE